MVNKLSGEVEKEGKDEGEKGRRGEEVKVLSGKMMK